VAIPPSFEVGLSQRLPWSCFLQPSLKFRTAGFPQYGFKLQALVCSARSLPVRQSGLSPIPTCPARPSVCSGLRIGLGQRVTPPLSAEPWRLTKPPGSRGPRSDRVIVSRPSSLNWPHPPVWKPSSHFPASLVIGRHLTFEDPPVWFPVLPSFRCSAFQDCRLQLPPGDPAWLLPRSALPALAIDLGSRKPWHLRLPVRQLHDG
jgi:hypothetical protein